jgi:hypothetical protein
LLVEEVGKWRPLLTAAQAAQTGQPTAQLVHLSTITGRYTHEKKWARTGRPTLVLHPVASF